MQLWKIEPEIYKKTSTQIFVLKALLKVMLKFTYSERSMRKITILRIPSFDPLRAPIAPVVCNWFQVVTN